MGYIASAFKAGNLIRPKKLDILYTRAQEQLGKDQTLIHILFFFLFVCFFLFRNSCQWNEGDWVTPANEF